MPLSLHQDPAKAALGRRLFNDVRLSGNSSVSCASCHNVARGGGDQRAKSLGFLGQPGAVNAPTVLNAALNFKQFWDGRADTLEAQLDMVIRNPVEMGSSWPAVLARLAGDAAYRDGFAAAYRDGLTIANLDFAQRGGANDADRGRYAVIHNSDDLHVFKVPSLRNVTRSAPYFHDGSAATLEQALDVLFKFQLGRSGSKQDKADIIRFLNTLNSTPAGQP